MSTADVPLIVSRRQVLITVAGIAKTQGSKKAFRNQHTGRIHMVESGGASHSSWREAVRAEAAKAMDGAPLMLGPVGLSLECLFVKPKSAPKRSAWWPTTRTSGDADKLARAVCDSLTGVVFRDDAQIVHLQVMKRMGDPPSAAIRVWEIT